MFMVVHCIETALNFTITQLDILYANSSSEISATIRDTIFDQKFNMVTYIGSSLSNCSFFHRFLLKDYQQFYLSQSNSNFGENLTEGAGSISMHVCIFVFPVSVCILIETTYVFVYI